MAHGRRCKVTALSTGLPRKRAVMRGYDVCASHGGKAGEGSKAVMAAPYDPVAAANRQAKRTRHRVYTQLRATSRALSQCKRAFSDLSGGSTVSAEPKPLYSQPSGNSASTAALCATAPPCTVGLRMRQSRRGSCRHSTQYERPLAFMVLGGEAIDYMRHNDFPSPCYL
jgi:hypothetical protein